MNLAEYEGKAVRITCTDGETFVTPELECTSALDNEAEESAGEESVTLEHNGQLIEIYKHEIATVEIL